MAVNPIDSSKISIGKISPIKSNNFGTLGIEETRDTVSFGDFLNSELNKVNSLQVEKSIAEQKLVTGEVEDIHSVMIAAEKADLALQFTLAIRNKFMDAYQEIMRMQI